MSTALAPVALPSATLAVVSPWSSRSLTLPPLGNLDAYISAVNRMPMLSAEQEQELRSLGCRRAQGFRFARPALPEDAEPVLGVAAS